jgi:methylenetetrahydrofolate--tRNA-(uracil-5-)-methyltransferase
MRRLGSLLLRCAQSCRVPAAALWRWTGAFFRNGHQAILGRPEIEVQTGEVRSLPDGPLVIATGPLTSEAFSEALRALCGRSLSFFDAAAPIVETTRWTAKTVCRRAVWARRGRLSQLPDDREGYERFIAALASAERAPLAILSATQGLRGLHAGRGDGGPRPDTRRQAR